MDRRKSTIKKSGYKTRNVINEELGQLQMSLLAGDAVELDQCQFEFLMPGFLGSQHSFQRGIVKPIKDGDEEGLSEDLDAEI